MHDSECNRTFGPVSSWAVFTNVSLGVVTVGIFVADMVMVVAMKLHHKVIYRLAVYQVIMAVVYSTVLSAGYLTIHYSSVRSLVAYSVTTLLSWIKFMLVMWLTIHVSTFTIWHRNLKKMEPFYVVSSLLIPLALTLIYVAVNVACDCPQLWVLYGFYTLLGLSFVPVLLSCGIFASTVGYLVRRMYCASGSRSVVLDRHYREALGEVLPLLGYPIILFSSLLIPIVVLLVTDREVSQKTAMYAVMSQGFNCLCTFLLMIHIGVIRLIGSYCGRKTTLMRVPNYIKINFACTH